MFSKALFKQSCKANGIMWAIITFAECFMLACVMLIMGGGNITQVKNGVEDTIIQSQIEASMKNRAINYYEINYGAMEYFDEEFIKAYVVTGDSTTSYLSSVQSLQGYAKKLIKEKGVDENSTEALEIQGVIFYTLNPQGEYNEFFTKNGEEATSYDMSTVTSANRDVYRQEHCASVASVFLSGNVTSEESVDAMVKELADYNVDKAKYESFGYTYANVKHMSATAVLTYQTRLNYETGLLDETAPDYEAQLEKVKKDIAGDLSGGFLATLPSEVSDALKEVGSMDLFNIVVGSIFYKMAGLLLPIIYVIMVSNSLIAGQVDSGSMAYILSTSTKRNEVTFTQAMYLILSVLAMVLLTTATSMVCLAIIASPDITLTYLQLLYMNIGMFAVLFAISGLCFFTSCWFNRSRNAMAIGGGISIFFLVATMLGLFGSSVLPSVVRISALNYFNYVSLITLFDVISILESTLTFVWKFAILFCIGLVFFIVGSVRFKKKDLPL